MISLTVSLRKGKINRENLFDYITVNVEQGILRIASKREIQSSRELKATISFKTLATLNVSGGGDIRSEINSQFIVCENAGGGDINLTNGERASEARFAIAGGGDIDLNIKADKLICSVSGGGDSDISGEVKDFEISLNGGGDVQAGQLITDITSFHVSGGSDIHVNASKEINGSITGGGDVYYKGSPEKVDIDARGGSEVLKE